MFFADSTLLFFFSLSHESLCLESSLEAFVEPKILSPVLGTPMHW